ncbi:hypothetical protein AB1M95_15890 [Sulfitobacter sp. LCG007]
MLRFLATIAAVVLGTGVQAATVSTSYDLQLELERITFVNVELTDIDGDTKFFDRVDKSAFIWPLDRTLPFSKGQSGVFQAQFETYPDGEVADVVSCRFLGYDCDTRSFGDFIGMSPGFVSFYLDGGFGFDYVDFAGGTAPGDAFRVTLFDAGPTFLGESDDFVIYGDIVFGFRVLQAQLTAVPLPAGSYLLGIGLGALFFLRRRQRRAS